MKLCDDCEIKPRAKHRKICYGCQSRNYRIKFPVRKVFYDLRSSAKKRSIPFKITLPQFEKFIVQTKYMKRRGRGSDDLTIDRIKEGGIYSMRNIQVISGSKNKKKFHAHFKKIRKRKQELEKESLPF